MDSFVDKFENARVGKAAGQFIWHSFKTPIPFEIPCFLDFLGG